MKISNKVDKITYTLAVTGLGLMMFTGTASSFWLFSGSFVVGMINLVYKEVNQYRDIRIPQKNI